MLAITTAMNMSASLSTDNSSDDQAVYDETGKALLHLAGNVISGVAATNTTPSGNNKQQLIIMIFYHQLLLRGFCSYFEGIE